MKDKKRAMGRGLGAILSAESKAVQSATDAGAKDLVGNIVELILMKKHCKNLPNPSKFWGLYNP